MDKETIKKHVEMLLQGESLTLYDVELKSMFGQPLVEVLLDSDDVAIDTEMLSNIHQKILTLSDDVISDDAMIEVSSVGCERPIHTLKDYQDAKGRYIYLVSDYYKGYADVIDISNDMCIIQVKERSKTSQISIPISKISQARRAVKI